MTGPPPQVRETGVLRNAAAGPWVDGGEVERDRESFEAVGGREWKGKD